MNVRMLALCGVVGLGGLGGCVDQTDSAPLRILGNAAPGDGCVVDPTTTTFRSTGFIEGGSVIGYVFTPSVRNDLQTVENELIAPKTIYVTHARVELSFYDPAFADVTSDASLLDFQVATSASVEPNGGLAGLAFEIVPAELLSLVSARLGPPTQENLLPRTVLDARVQLVGTRGGGGGEEVSNVFRYPVEVCSGCVAIDVGACLTVPTGFEAGTGGVCNTLQDGVLECCDNFTVCPAAAPPPT